MRISRTTCIAAMLSLLASGVLAQTNAPAGSAAAQGHAQAEGPTYEVTSVKIDPNGDPNKSIHGDETQNGLALENWTLELMVRQAYGLKSYQVLGAPGGWYDQKEWQVEARLSDDEAAKLAAMNKVDRAAERRLLLQSLLADRFKLAVHHETRDVPGFALVVAKGGPRFQEASADDIANLPLNRTLTMENGELTFRAASMPTFVVLLSQVMNQSIVDRTNLTGKYKFSIPWKEEEFQVSASPSDDPSSSPISEILQDRLGLKLESMKLPTDFIVIDHVEEPAPN
jgi:uncharacterized protein (TIGR03435 family)